MTTVVNVRDGVPYDVYIGRRVYRGKYRLDESKWANPYRLRRGASLAERLAAIARYRDEHLPAHPELGAAVPELHDKTIACWCAPLPCHGDVLAELAEGRS
jgi:hypothetical protein